MSNKNKIIISTVLSIIGGVIFALYLPIFAFLPSVIWGRYALPKIITEKKAEVWIKKIFTIFRL